MVYIWNLLTLHIIEIWNGPRALVFGMQFQHTFEKLSVCGSRYGWSMTKKHEQERGIALHFTLHNPQGKLTHTTKSRYKLRHHGTVFLGHLHKYFLPELQDGHWHSSIQRVPTLRGFWDLKKTALHKIFVSGTVGGFPLTQRLPTCAYISQKLQ